MFRKDAFLEYYFRSITILFWCFVIFNWIFILHRDISVSLFSFFAVFSVVYLAIFTALKLREGDLITFFYRAFSVLTFILSLLYLFLYPISMKLLLLKSLMIVVYFYISAKKLFTQKDEEGLVGIIGSALLFIFGIYY